MLISTNLIYSNDLDINSNENLYPTQVQTVKQQKREVINITNEELLLLSKLVTGEARGESYEGQVAVAAVVINRVKDPRFPNSIKDVIYQKNAFSVVKNGSINLQPTESAYSAAQDALYGKDPTDKAIYFWNPDIATCKWIKTLNPYMRIGNHVFAK
jgi:N-acetylmuramoyl-L-alanine amidase